MKNNKLYIFIICIFLSSGAWGQNLHFSQYEKAPTIVNPGLTGHFKGTYRGNAIYRFQNFNSGKYNTLMFTADLPVVRGIRKQDWIGAGITLGGDQSGVVAPNTTQGGPTSEAAQKISMMGFNAAYHMANKKQNQIFSIGASYTTGSMNYSNNLKAENFASGLISTLSSIAQKYNNSQSGNAPSASLNNLSVGLMYNTRDKGTDFKIGASINGLLASDIKAVVDSAYTRPLGINGVLSYSHQVNKQTSFTHGLFYYSQGSAYAINANSRIFYQINPEKDLRLIGGLGTRTLQSAILYLGVETGPWQVGLSYDIDISGSTPITDTFKKGIELGATYIGIVSKRPKQKPVIFCPRI